MPELLCLLLAIALPAGENRVIDFPHIRSDSPRIARLAGTAVERSSTFHRLAAALSDSDVIVYIDAGECQCGRARACLSFVSASGGVRYLRASVSLRQIDDELIEQIGHELQHAIEIASEPRVTSEVALAAYYSARAQSCGRAQCFETAHARDVQAAIRRELRRRAAR